MHPASRGEEPARPKGCWWPREGALAASRGGGCFLCLNEKSLVPPLHGPVLAHFKPNDIQTTSVGKPKSTPGLFVMAGGIYFRVIAARGDGEVAEVVIYVLIWVLGLRNYLLAIGGKNVESGKNVENFKIFPR